MTGRQFVAVVPEQVQALGRPAATVLAHLTYLTRRRPDGVVATVQDLADSTCLSVRTTHRAIAVLRDAGLVTSERADAWNPTQRWVVRDCLPGQHVTANVAATQTASVAVTSTPTEGVEELQAPPAPTEQGTLPFLVVVPDPPAASDEVEKDATAQVSGPPKTAQTLVARWVDGYRSVNAGRDPHRAVMGRVAGQCRNLAKACGDDHDSWVDAWHAAFHAGVAGTHDLVRHLVPQQQRRQDGRAGRNAFASPAFGGPDQATVDRFTAALGGDQPRALGSAQ